MGNPTNTIRKMVWEALGTPALRSHMKSGTKQAHEHFSVVNVLLSEES